MRPARIAVPRCRMAPTIDDRRPVPEARPPGAELERREKTMSATHPRKCFNSAIPGSGGAASKSHDLESGGVSGRGAPPPRRATRAFRAEHGFGRRAISAPQIGVTQRFIAAHLGEGTFLDRQSGDHVGVPPRPSRCGDDCMSFPSLLVRVRRHRSISVRFTTGEGESIVWEALEPAVSELLQHEIDHLDGVIAVDRAPWTCDAIVSRAAFEAPPRALPAAGRLRHRMRGSELTQDELLCARTLAEPHTRPRPT